MAKSQPTNYLPEFLMGGNTTGRPQKGLASPVGKARTMQQLGNYTGQRAAGITRKMIGGDDNDAMNHAFGHYGKPKESSLKGM